MKKKKNNNKSLLELIRERRYSEALEIMKKHGYSDELSRAVIERVLNE